MFIKHLSVLGNVLIQGYLQILASKPVNDRDTNYLYLQSTITVMGTNNLLHISPVQQINTVSIRKVIFQTILRATINFQKQQKKRENAYFIQGDILIFVLERK